jgi:hypothetical protein
MNTIGEWDYNVTANRLPEKAGGLVYISNDGDAVSRCPPSVPSGKLNCRLALTMSLLCTSLL